MKTHRHRYRHIHRHTTSKSKTKRAHKHPQFLYHPDNPVKSFNVYINKNPKDTIHIKYKTLNDVKATIRHLEALYKSKKYSHKRIWQVGMIMKVRLEVLKDKKPEEFRLSKKYFDFLSDRTDLSPTERYLATFHI